MGASLKARSAHCPSSFRLPELPLLLTFLPLGRPSPLQPSEIVFNACAVQLRIAGYAIHSSPVTLGASSLTMGGLSFPPSLRVVDVASASVAGPFVRSCLSVLLCYLLHRPYFFYRRTHPPIIFVSSWWFRRFHRPALVRRRGAIAQYSRRIPPPNSYPRYFPIGLPTPKPK